MLFNSLEFVIFLPCTLFVFFALAATAGPRASLFGLAAASLFFYSWWNPANLPILVGSTLFNFFVARAFNRSEATRYPLLVFGIASNILLLVYFKYLVFLAGIVSNTFGVALAVQPRELPLGISFFTFTQIAFLVDAYRRAAREYDLTRYALFVTYYPHLIAGPIIHHAEMMPQFADRSIFRPKLDNICVGLVIFVFGLAKKVVLADNVAAYATVLFSAAESGPAISGLEAWIGTLAYTMQLYFDFSAYCDMAIGISFMFGIRLPLNFNSPYRATSVIEFWQRWHMTLSRFLRDYLYIPLGGSRRGFGRQLLNVSIVMVVGGAWHGAGWTFLVWGALHAVYISINHVFRRLRQGRGEPGRLVRLGFWLVTFLAVSIAWIPFRAQSIGGAWTILRAMAGGGEWIALPPLIAGVVGKIVPGFHAAPAQVYERPADFLSAVLITGLLSLAAVLLPNLQQMFMREGPSLDGGRHLERSRLADFLHFRWSPAFGIGLGVLIFMIAHQLVQNRTSEFLYFDF